MGILFVYGDTQEAGLFSCTMHIFGKHKMFYLFCIIIVDGLDNNKPSLEDFKNKERMETATSDGYKQHQRETATR